MIVASVGRSVLRQRWRPLVGLVLVLGVLCGAGMASMAGARRTQSAYPRFLRWANVSTMAVDAGSDRNFLAIVERFPEVIRHRRYTAVDLAFLTHGRPDPASLDIEALASADGRYFDQDKFVAVDGRRPDPTRIDEIGVNRDAARVHHLHVGQRLDLGTFDDAQVSGGTPPSQLKPVFRMTAVVVGIGSFPEEVVQDESDRSSLVLLTPAFYRRVARFGTYSWEGLILRHGDADVAAVKRRYHALITSGFPEFYRVTSVDTFHAEQAVRPLSIALGLFGVIAFGVGLVLAALGVSREIAAVAGLRRDLRALGVAPRTGLAIAVLGPLLAIVVGAVVAVVVAAAASPAMPLGQVRRVEVRRGVDVDLVVLGLGAAAILLVLGAVGLLIGWRTRPAAVMPGGPHRRVSRIGAAAGRAGGSPPLVIGLWLAFGHGVARAAASARSVVFGSAVAITALVAALTFSTSLTALVRHPALYGWTWDGVALAGAGYFNVDRGEVTKLMRSDPDIVATSGVHFGSGSIDGQNVPLLGFDPGALVVPPLVAGRAPESPTEVALGSDTAGQLGRHVGDSVRLTADHGTVRRTVVGIMVFPTIGIVHGAHTSLGTGAWVSAADVPGVDRRQAGLPEAASGPNAVLIRLGNDRNGPREMARLKRLVSGMGQGGLVSFHGVQRPAEIVNTTDLGGAPAVLSGLLVGGSVLALAVTLAASVRRRRGDLAVLKALGLTRRQIAATVVWQSTVTVLPGLVVGLPLGLLMGRSVWTRFAEQLSVVPHVVLPWTALALLAIGVLAVANLVAAVPGWLAARTPVSSTLRTE
ncbi:MAG: hypothetical protein JWN46_898 [Acidimicrobiales bacterium]|nr:hypothetical protein [Acidimicrobiales bacterium]